MPQKPMKFRLIKKCIESQVKKRWKNFAASVKKCTFASEMGMSERAVSLDMPMIVNDGQWQEMVERDDTRSAACCCRFTRRSKVKKH